MRAIGSRIGARLAVLVLALAVHVPEASAQRLGRLFTSVDERASLEELRYQSQFATPAPAPEPVAVVPGAVAQSASVVSSLTVNGIVRSSDGSATVWINGDQIQRGGSTREGIRVITTGPGGRNVRARLPSGVDTIDLKPGQKIDVLHGVVLEPYERSERTPAGPSAFRLEPGPEGLLPAGHSDVEPATSSTASPAAVAAAPGPAGLVTGTQRDAAVIAILRAELESLPPEAEMTPVQRAQAEALRRQIERTSAGTTPAPP